MVIKEIENNIIKLNDTFALISNERKELLNELARYISEKVKAGDEVNLNFICTHNSRRSHMGQIWGQTAAEYYGIENVKCFSGGTEATAFNPRAVNAIRDYGYEIIQKDNSGNPLYLVKYSDEKEPLICFSKVYNDEFNPQNNFAAIMTCSDADENCPVVFGAEARFPIRYKDPKEYDNTDLEAKMYKERFEEIGREMLYLFSNVNEG
ncbi:MAG: protein-tyrosine-phosphatase [Ignavibacteriae bacterium]|nr:protein-tyrosine-phosphatase [Ignavibacteriota bacterium]